MQYEIKKLTNILSNVDETCKDFTVIDIKIFKQCWPSTRLGFPGIGGDAMTSAYTTIITTSEFKDYVFFDDALAYIISNPTQRYKEDVRNHQMQDVITASKIYEHTKHNEQIK